jgi:hypothetical protein
MRSESLRVAAALVALLFCAPLAAPAACLDMDAPGEGTGHGCCTGAGLTAGAPDCCIENGPPQEASTVRGPLPIPILDRSFDVPCVAVAARAVCAAAVFSRSLHGPPPLALRV